MTATHKAADAAVVRIMRQFIIRTRHDVGCGMYVMLCMVLGGVEGISKVHHEGLTLPAQSVLDVCVGEMGVV